MILGEKHGTSYLPCTNLMMDKCTDEELDVFIAALRELMKHKR